MIEIKIQNKELQNILDQWLDVLLQADRSGFPYMDRAGRGGLVSAEYACGEEYLQIMQNKKVDGFPEKT